MAFDAWHHFQVAIDVQTRSFRLLVQVLGEPPRELCRGEFESLPKAGEPLAIILCCHRTQPRADGPAFDNVLVTSGRVGD